jgi:hypothetical protein
VAQTPDALLFHDWREIKELNGSRRPNRASEATAIRGEPKRSLPLASAQRTAVKLRPQQETEGRHEA